MGKREKYKEPITIEAIQAVLDYMEDTDYSISVVKAELGELVLRATGEYWED